MKNIIALPLCLALALPGTAATLTNRPIAKVDGETILLSEFTKNWETLREQQQQNGMPPEKMDDAWKAQARRKLLDQMVDDKILLAEAKKRKIKVNQRDFENGVLQVKARFLPEPAQRQLQIILRRQTAAAGPNADQGPDLGLAWKDLQTSNPAAIKEAEATFKKELQKENMEEKKFMDRLRDQLGVSELAKQEVRQRVMPPTDEDVKALYGRVLEVMDGKKVPGLSGEDAKDMESMAQFYKQQTGERVRARHILIGAPSSDGKPGWEKASLQEKTAARKKIDALRKQILNGADFAELAKENSDDKGSGEKGGDLGFFTKGQMVPPFEKAAFSLPVGELSGIVESQFGLHLIRVEEKKAATKLRFDEAEDDLREYLFRASQQAAFESFVTELRKNASVKILVSPEELAQL